MSSSFFSRENEDVIVDIAIEAGADDVVTKENEGIEVITSIELLETIKQTFDEKNITYLKSNQQSILNKKTGSI